MYLKMDTGCPTGSIEDCQIFRIEFSEMNSFQICRVLCDANNLPNLTNQGSSFQIFVWHKKSGNTMLYYCTIQLLAREESGRCEEEES